MSLDLENMSIEDFDEKLANLRDIAQKGIDYLRDEDYTDKSIMILQEELNKEMNE